jgi:hypothetical protein
MRQLTLHFPPHADALRVAFKRCPGLAQRMSFEQSVRHEAVRRCLAVVAEIQHKPRKRI